MTRGVWKDDQRYLDAYWSRFPGMWTHGDFAMVDDDGQWFILGRSDDVMNVAGKRLAPAEVLPDGWATLDAGGVHVGLDLSGAIDVAAETARIQQEDAARQAAYAADKAAYEARLAECHSTGARGCRWPAPPPRRHR